MAITAKDRGLWLLLAMGLTSACGNKDSDAEAPTEDAGVRGDDDGDDAIDGAGAGAGAGDDGAGDAGAGDAGAGDDAAGDAGAGDDAAGDAGAGDDAAGDDAGPDDAGPDEPRPTAFAPVIELSSAVFDVVHDLRGVAFASSGQIYASGHVGVDVSAVDRELAVVRFNDDGTLDETFGVDGVARHNLVVQEVEDEAVVNAGDEQSMAIVELSSGDLIVHANVTAPSGLGQDVVLLKLNADGEIVSEFGDDGIVRVDFGWTPADDAGWPDAASGPTDNGWDVILDRSSGEEKLVVFGYGPAKAGALVDPNDVATQRTDNDRYVVRLLSDGSTDPAFNAGMPYALHSGGDFSDGGRRGYVAEDGAIVSAGYTNFGENFGNHILLARLQPDGTPDTSFGFGIGLPGVVRSNPFIDDGGVAECYAVGVQSTGRYVTTGYGRATGASMTSRYGYATTDGVDLVSFGFTESGLDATFGNSGTMAIQSEEHGLAESEDRGRDLVVLPDDRVVHVGRFGAGPAILVTLPDGGMDLESGLDGRFEYPADTEHFFKVALSADGTRIAATTRNHAAGVRLTLLGVGE